MLASTLGMGSNLSQERILHAMQGSKKKKKLYIKKFFFLLSNVYLTSLLLQLGPPL